ncbi:MAG: AbgT family transporter, partial [Planctomycetota bacterium]|nr:AbgT family transporter [Planctomycetota bacterium]
TAFAGTAGGFSANFLPSALDPLLQGFTQQAVRLIDPVREVNPLCNWGFMSASCLVIVLVGWYVSDRLIEPRLKRIPVDGEKLEASAVGDITAREKKGLWVGFAVLALGLLLLTQRVVTPELLFPSNKSSPESADTGISANTAINGEVTDSNATLRRILSYVLPSKSAWHSEKGELVSADAPLMQSIVPLIFLLFLLPGTAYGYIAGTLKGHRDVVAGMTKSMGTITYYLVMAFFAAQFTAAFKDSNLGVLLAIKGANLLRAWNLEPQYTILGIISFTSLVNLIIGSASAKWALLGPIFVPMLMQNGISPELTQCAYRIGDSSINIITPLMPYFPLVVVYCQRYCKTTGIGTLVSLMMPYSLAFLMTWSILLMIFWRLGLPLGINAPYTYP